MRPKLATIASWAGYDLDGRTDIAWTFSIKVRLLEKRAALADVRERFIVLKHKLEETDAPQRIARQIVGKLDLAIAAVDDQIKGVEGVIKDPSRLAGAANMITKTDGYNLLTVEPLLTLLNSLIDSVSSPQMKRSIAALAGLAEVFDRCPLPMQIDVYDARRVLQYAFQFPELPLDHERPAEAAESPPAAFTAVSLDRISQ